MPLYEYDTDAFNNIVSAADSVHMILHDDLSHHEKYAVIKKKDKFYAVIAPHLDGPFVIEHESAQKAFSYIIAMSFHTFAHYAFGDDDFAAEIAVLKTAKELREDSTSKLRANFDYREDPAFDKDVVEALF